ncbi:DNA ligase 1-like [Macrobrachium rosenbergii]|uniref:DNA ligase 1-like n=1 Tax=Macrobrachium rosenbergii TaxID=79674 RepID=UPI0034D5122B
MSTIRIESIYEVEEFLNRETYLADLPGLLKRELQLVAQYLGVRYTSSTKKDEMLAAIVNKLQESNEGEASGGEDEESAQGDDEWVQGEGEEAQEERAQALDIEEKVEVKPELGDVELKRLQLQVQLKKMDKEVKLKEFELETKRMELELAEKEKARKFELEEKERQRQFELAREKERARQHELEVLKLGGKRKRGKVKRERTQYF